MAKEKNFNPVQEQRKKEKAREIKKGQLLALLDFSTIDFMLMLSIY